ncbi:hypothetical protein Ancab_006814 [Ancistrocladus abbreviatus]
MAKVMQNRKKKRKWSDKGKKQGCWMLAFLISQSWNCHGKQNFWLLNDEHHLSRRRGGGGQRECDMECCHYLPPENRSCIALWNPSIIESWTLPSCFSLLSDHASWVGHCFDPISHDIKVIAFTPLDPHNGVGMLDYIHFVPTLGKCWPAFCSNHPGFPRCMNLILSYDLKKKVFLKTDLPELIFSSGGSSKDKNKQLVNVLLLSQIGSLALIVHYDQQYLHPEAIGFWNHGQALLLEDVVGELVSYNSSIQQIVELKVEGAAMGQMFIYTESLVSVKGG